MGLKMGKIRTFEGSSLSVVATMQTRY